jgi:hypothetical protein
MRRIESISDRTRGTVTYELKDGFVVCLDGRDVRKYGAAELIRDMGYGHLLPSERVPVMRRGRCIGTLPPDFDPMSAKVNSLFYDLRPGDFRREGDVWIACHTLGPGDLEAVPGFVFEPGWSQVSPPRL